MSGVIWYFRITMRSIYNIGGTSRLDRKPWIQTNIDFLESDFSRLFCEAMESASQKEIIRSDGKRICLADMYKYQPLSVCAEIISCKVSEIQNLVHSIGTNPMAEDALKLGIRNTLERVEDWRKRIEWASIQESCSYSLLNDLNEHVEVRWSAIYQEMNLLFPSLTFKEMGAVWHRALINALSLPSAHDFLFRVGYQLVGFLENLRAKMPHYLQEIMHNGNMDPSLALMVYALSKYAKMAGAFNQRLQGIGDFYYDKILETKCRGAKKGKFWVSSKLAHGLSSFLLPSNSLLCVGQEEGSIYGRTLADSVLTTVELNSLSWWEVEKSKERHPESDLDYVTSLSLASLFPESDVDDKKLGIGFRSPIFKLESGHRHIEVHCVLTDDSVSFFEDMIRNVSQCQQISEKDAQNKVLNESTFSIYLSTSLGLQETDKVLIDFLKRDSEGKIVISLELDSKFPALVAMEDNSNPEIRVLVSDKAWLYPYSWCRRVKLKKIKVNVTVEGTKNFQIHNDLGEVDVTQPFSPFGSSTVQGAWFAFGSEEMLNKRVSQVSLSLTWRGLPKHRLGMKGHYSSYVSDDSDVIDNTSFRVKGEYLSGYSWKPSLNAGEQYMFRTSADEVPVADDLLVEKSRFTLSVPPLPDVHLSDSEFEYGSVPSGFYRFVFTSPLMGFGESVYRRIFAETMLVNSKLKHHLPLPEPPVMLMADSASLGYKAEAETEFIAGGDSEIEVCYLQPAFGFSSKREDFSTPIPIINGIEEGGRLVLSLSGTLDFSLLSFYLSLEDMTVEMNAVPKLVWSYRTESGWKNFSEANVLTDDTYGLSQSGYVSLLMPETVTADMLDAKGLLWISALVEKGYENCAKVKGLYTNVVQVETEFVEEEIGTIPEIESSMQISPIKGQREKETEEEMQLRIRERISHRNRALLATDYEQLVLRNFLQIDRVSCIPHLDTKHLGRRNLITLVVLRKKTANEEVPLCTDSELREIENFLKGYVSPFVSIDVINPEYEYVTIFCGVKTLGGLSSGGIVNQVREELGRCVSPWLDGVSAPVLGHSFSVMDLQDAIRNVKGISQTYGFKVIHVYRKPDNTYERSVNEWILGNDEGFRISPSRKWALLSVKEVYVKPLVSEAEWNGTSGIGDFEIGDTFVIEAPKGETLGTFDC